MSAILSNVIRISTRLALVCFAVGYVSARAEEAVPQNFDASDDIPAVTAVMQLNPVQGAKKYQVQVKALSQLWEKPFETEIEESVLRLRLTPGFYSMRRRTLNDGEPAGEWGEWEEIQIPEPKIKAKFPADDAQVEPKGILNEQLLFEWPAVEGAKSYIFSLFDSDGNRIRYLRLTQLWVRVELPSNSTYKWSVTPEASAEVPPANWPKAANHRFSVDNAPEEVHRIGLHVEPVKDAVAYDFEIVKFVDAKQVSSPSVFTSAKPDLKIPLAPGKYEIRVRTDYSDGAKSNWTPPNEFWVQIAPPKRKSPKESEVIDPTDSLNSVVHLKWQPVKNAKRYRVFVRNEKDVLIENSTTEETSLEVRLPHNALYKWNVSAVQELQTDSHRDFPPVSQGYSVFEIGRYKPLSLSSGEEPSHLYAWGRYLASNMSFKSTNYDNNTYVRENIFGGTGELAGGYWHRKTDVGILLAAAGAGFTAVGKTYSYMYSSALLGYRGRNAAETSNWRIWAGLAYKETPEVLRDNNSQQIIFSKLAGFGPEVRFSYLGEIDKTYGYQIYASYIKVTQQQKTVNGLPLKGMSAYNLGVYATKRLSHGYTGMIGYSYMLDEASYQARDTTVGDTNSLSLGGHFISFTLEFGLRTAER